MAEPIDRVTLCVPGIAPGTPLELGDQIAHEWVANDETPRRVLERWPDAEYPPGHPCHNPYGVWRVGPAGGVGGGVSELVPVFAPSLAAGGGAHWNGTERGRAIMASPVT